MVGTKHAFWQALLFTIAIFAFGFLLGFVLENSRVGKVEIAIANSEINLLDEQVRVSGINQFDIDCNQAKLSTFNFADKIYLEASQLEVFDSSAKFTDELRTLHKKYDLLRMILWMEGIDLKKNCGEKINTVVYIFEYNSQDINQKALQNSMSKMLADLKSKYGEEVLLIPLAGNLNIESVNLIKEKYKINELPAIIIDEKAVITGETSFEELEKKLFGTDQNELNNSNKKTFQNSTQLFRQ